jgi:hypothetical protein
MFKKKIISLAVASVILSSFSVNAEETKFEVKTVSVPFSVLNINDADPRYNHKAELTFALDEKGYFPLTGMMISQDARNPFTAVEVLHGYLFAKKSEVTKNDIAIVNKLIDTNYRYDTLNTYSADLIRLVIDKSYLLGEYVTTSEMSDWLKNAPEEGRERVRSNILKLQKFFAEKNVQRDKSDKELSGKLSQIYTQARELLSDELKKNLDVEYYLKSLLYQDEDTRQVTEQVLLNTLSANDIGEVAAVAEIIVNTMVKDKLSVTINNHARNSVINADTMPNVDFSGKFYRVYSGNDALAYALKMLDTISIEANKDGLNQYVIRLTSGEQVYETVGKVNKSDRGIEFSLDNFLNNRNFYGEIQGDELKIYAAPEQGNELVLSYKRIKSESDKPQIELKDYTKVEIPKPEHTTPLTGKNTDLSYFKPTSIAMKWLNMSENYTVDLKELLNLEQVYKKDHDFGLVLMSSACSNKDTEQVCNDAQPYLDRFVVVDSKSPDYKKEALDCDELSVGASVQRIELSNGVTGFLSLSDYVSSNDQSFLSATVPYKTGKVCLAVNLGKNLSYEPKKLIEGIKLLNDVIFDYSKGE